MDNKILEHYMYLYRSNYQILLIYIWWPQYPRGGPLPSSHKSAARRDALRPGRSSPASSAASAPGVAMGKTHGETHGKTHGTTTTVELSETKTSIVHRYAQ